jgi:hypothetical protein
MKYTNTKLSNIWNCLGRKINFKQFAIASIFLTSASSTMLSFSRPAVADAPNYTTEWTGTWVNQNSNTSGITRFVLIPNGAHKFKVRVFGKCHPTDCDWGVTEMTTYARQDGYYFYGTANYAQGFKNSELIFTLAEGSVVLESFNHFLDNSGRQNYYTRDQFTHSTSVLPRH